MEDSENQDQNLDYAAFYSESSFWQKSLSFLGGLKDRLMEAGRVTYMIFGGLGLLLIVWVVLSVFVNPAIVENNQSNLTGAVLEEPKVERLTILPRTADTSAVVAHVRNTTKGYGVSNIPYTFRTFDAQGEMLSESQGATYLMPAQDKFLVLPVVGVIPAKAELVLAKDSLEYLRPILGQDIDLQLINVEGVNTEAGFTIKGTASNRTAYVFYAYEVTVILRNASGGIEGAVSTQLENIRPGEFKNFELIWPKQLPSNTIVDARITVNKMSRINFDLYAEENSNSGSIR